MVHCTRVIQIEPTQFIANFWRHLAKCDLVPHLRTAALDRTVNYMTMTRPHLRGYLAVKFSFLSMNILNKLCI